MCKLILWFCEFQKNYQTLALLNSVTQGVTGKGFTKVCWWKGWGFGLPVGS